MAFLCWHTDPILMVLSKLTSLPHIRRPKLRAPLLVFLSAVWIATVHNLTLWGLVSERLDFPSMTSIGFSLTLFGILTFVYSLPMLLLGQRIILKPIIWILLILSGTLAYFTSEHGIVFDSAMVGNLLNSVRDQNAQIGFQFLSRELLINLILTTLTPLFFIAWVRVKPQAIISELLSRAGYLVLLLGVVSGLFLANFKSIAHISAQNSDLESVITPWYALKTANYLRRSKTKVQPQLP